MPLHLLIGLAGNLLQFGQDCLNIFSQLVGRTWGVIIKTFTRLYAQLTAFNFFLKQ
jgi:hypothetical protein